MASSLDPEPIQRGRHLCRENFGFKVAEAPKTGHVSGTTNCYSTAAAVGFWPFATDINQASAVSVPLFVWVDVAIHAIVRLFGWEELQ